MKKTILVISSLYLCSLSIAQDIEKPSAEILLKELSENACTCVEEIDTYNKSSTEVAREASACIDEQAGALQLGSKLFAVADLKEDAEEVNGKKQINVSINPSKDSKEYKEYYYQLERYMMANCVSLKEKIASNDKQSNTSKSQNIKAIKFYDQGTVAFQKEDFVAAVNYFQKAVKEDPEFAFAWDNLGISYRRLDKFDEAIAAYETSLKIDPSGLMPLQNIAVAYQYKKEYDKAIKAYESLAEIDPDNPEVFYGLGNLYASYLKDYSKGLDTMCKAYVIYIAKKSPYRTDAEKVINSIYTEMKNKGEEDQFFQILKENNININE